MKNYPFLTCMTLTGALCSTQCLPLTTSPSCLQLDFPMGSSGGDQRRTGSAVGVLGFQDPFYKVNSSWLCPFNKVIGSTHDDSLLDLLLWPILEKNNLSMEKLILCHSFKGFTRFSTWLPGSVSFRSLTRQKHYGRRSWKRKDVHLTTARKQRERKGRGQDQHIPFKSMSPVIYFCQLGPAIHSFTISL